MSDFVKKPLHAKLNKNNILTRIENLEQTAGARPSATTGNLASLTPDAGDLSAGTFAVYDQTTGALRGYITATPKPEYPGYYMVFLDASGVLQVGIDADTGELVAGAGVVTLNNNGVNVEVSTDATPNDLNSYKFSDLGITVIGLYGYLPNANYVSGDFIVKNKNRADFYLSALGNVDGLLEISATGGLKRAQIDLDCTGAAPIIQLNGASGSADTRISGNGDVDMFYADESAGRIGIGTSAPSEKLDVVGNIKASGTITGTIDFTALSNPPVAETNTADIFSVTSPGGVSLWTGTISGAPSGANVTVSAPTSGTEAVLKPTNTNQLAKMRVYNTVAGRTPYALISDYNTATNVLTLTANASTDWVNTDTLSIVSQTVSGGGGNWIDLEITSGPTGKSSLFVKTQITSAGATDSFVIHPFEASFSTSKYDICEAQVANRQKNSFALLKIVSNVFSMTWSGSPTSIFVREAGYIK